MKFRYLLLCLCNAIACTASGFCKDGDKHTIKAKTTIAAAQEDDYDVQYIKLDLSATNTSTSISGLGRTVARVVVSSLTDYYFELSNQLTIDSAFIDGQPYSVTSINSFVRKITLASPLAQNTVFTADIYYHGAPTGGTGFFTNGILNQTDATVPVQVTHTVSAVIHSRDWFPCKQSLTDKIDSADVWVAVPSGLKVAGNGLLKNITPIGLNYDRYEWSMRYPVDYYLISFSIAPYAEYSYYMHFANSSDSMLIQNYIYNTPSVLQQHQDELDSIAHVVNYFSSLFGRYPFDKEKFGICMTPLSGGMENQTMVSLGSLDMTLIAHELSHQWWGDHVTCQSLRDMWLNEGFATYCEQLFLEHFHSAAVMQAERTAVHNVITTGIGSSGGSVYVDDTTQEGRIYNTRLTYYKGAAVAHMLRYVINNDAQYFQVLQNYQQQFGHQTATTDDLKDIAEQVTNMDLDTFFHQWVYKEGYPVFGGQWTQNGSQVVIRLTQSTSKPASVSVFQTPVDIQLKSAQGDTVIRVWNDHNVQYYTFNWSKQVSNIVIDPYDHILNKSQAFVNDPAILNLSSFNKQILEIYPNPSTDSWAVRNLPLHATLYLSDVQGKRIWEQTTNADSVIIASRQLASGTYVLTVVHGGNSYSYQLVKQ